MANLQEVLIPIRFMTFILQVLLSISCPFTLRENVLKTLGERVYEDYLWPDYKKHLIYFWIMWTILIITEMVEFVLIMFTSVTLFNLKLSIAHIIFYSVGVILLNEFILKTWIIKDFVTILIVGGLLPFAFEMVVLLFNYNQRRKLTKVV